MEWSQEANGETVTAQATTSSVTPTKFLSRSATYLRLHDADSGRHITNVTKKTWTLSIILTLTGLAAAQFFSYTSVYILSSFYPPLAEAKHLSGMETGLVIGIITGIFTFSAYSFVQMTHVVSPELQVVLGLAITGSSTIAFGFLNTLPDGSPFFAACFFVRMLQGVGIAATDMCVLMIANQVVPKHVFGFVIGILESILTAAVAAAPAIGGYLYEAGGFFCPFVVSGVTAIVCAVYCYLVFPSTDKIEKQSLRTILNHSFSFDMLIYIIQFVLGGGFTGFFAGFIEPQLRQFNLSPGKIGLLILITNAVSGMTFPIWGCIIDRLKAGSLVTVIGSLLTATGFILFGPFPNLPLEPSLPLMCVSLVLVGTGISAILISVYAAAREFLLSTCGNEDLANTVLASSYPSSCNIGAFLVILLGGAFVDWIGYRKGAAVLFGLQLLGLALFLILLAKRRSRQRENVEHRERLITSMHVTYRTL